MDTNTPRYDLGCYYVLDFMNLLGSCFVTQEPLKVIRQQNYIEM